LLCPCHWPAAQLTHQLVAAVRVQCSSVGVQSHFRSACAPTCNNTSWPMKIGLLEQHHGGKPASLSATLSSIGSRSRGPDSERAFKSPGPLAPGLRLGRRWLLGACRPPSHGHRRHWQCAHLNPPGPPGGPRLYNPTVRSLRLTSSGPSAAPGPRPSWHWPPEAPGGPARIRHSSLKGAPSPLKSPGARALWASGLAFQSRRAPRAGGAAGGRASARAQWPCSRSLPVCRAGPGGGQLVSSSGSGRVRLRLGLGGRSQCAAQCALCTQWHTPWKLDAQEGSWSSIIRTGSCHCCRRRRENLFKAASRSMAPFSTPAAWRRITSRGLPRRLVVGSDAVSLRSAVASRIFERTWLDSPGYQWRCC
jgi:hypothetical protein